MRRNLAQSLFQYGQIETTLVKAKDVRPFVERLITLARRGDLPSRQRLISLLTDRAMIGRDEQEKYEEMSLAQRKRVLTARSGRRHRAGKVPAPYNKKKFPFVARSIIHHLTAEVAPRYKDRPGGYTRIIRLAKRRIGDNSDLAILQLVGSEGEAETGHVRKSEGRRRKRAQRLIEFSEGRREKRRAQKPGASATEKPAAAGGAASPEPPAGT
jgi:large subunit ribosomal protein L17